jgi:hypothetical protein
LFAFQQVLEGAAGRFAAGYLFGVFEEAGDPHSRNLLRLGLTLEVAAAEVEEGELELGVGGEEGADLGELLGAAAVLEGVEVAGRGAGAGAGAAPSTPAAARLRAGSSGWCGHGHDSVWELGGRSKGEVAEAPGASAAVR